MKRYITVDGRRFLIRGTATAKDLRRRYRAFVARYRSSLSLEQWLVERGGAYFEAGR